MSAANPEFFKTPIRYLRWASIQKPAYFWSIVIGSMGPLSFVVAPPIRRFFGDEKRPTIPLTYPIPKGPRPRPSGFED
ncbi:NADH-ubiquinone oxidoreductase 9.5 kDa subunit [Delitschia confertaspora ATCC 74209]|uniref:NADH-ubiquinone oxidoreductase 9.5 kDa subunit n=1 Tax=Delitschia confertaspora ATCC 74209 TaxID=1513339 RepID=A0A9P4MP92_9PLEO|nr:NADH-ubiquinone oxidoreductase 9.5 kDa subunit [Delitschia confertaspora ATCC 74209]